MAQIHCKTHFLAGVALAALSLGIHPAIAAPCAQSGVIAGSCEIDNANPPTGNITSGNGVVLTIEQSPTLGFDIDADVGASTSLIIDAAASPTNTGNIGSADAMNNLTLNSGATFTNEGAITLDGQARIQSNSNLIIRNNGSINAVINGQSGNADLIFDGTTNFQFQQDAAGSTFQLTNNATVSTNGVAIGQNNATFAQNGFFGLTIGGGSTFTIDSDSNFALGTGELANSGRVNIMPTATLRLGSNGINNTGGTIAYNILTNTTGTIDLAVGDIVINAADIEVVVDNGNTLNIGDELLIANGSTAVNGGAGLAATNVTDDSATFDFQVADGAQAEVTGSADNTQLYLVVVANSGGGGGGGGGNQPDSPSNTQTFNVLEAIRGTANPELAQIITNLDNAANSQELNNILESTQPTVDSGYVTGTLNVISQSTNLTTTRLNTIRDGVAGVATGEADTPLSAQRVWVQAFGRSADQKQRNGVAGYNMDSFGVSVGADTDELIDDSIIGVAFTYADTDIDSDNVNSTKTDTQSYQLAVYGSYNLDENSFINAQLSYTLGDNDTTRTNIGGAGGETATGSFNSHAISAYAELGKQVQKSQTLTLIPSASVEYTYFWSQDYTETGAGGANLRVEGESVDVLEFGANLTAQWSYQLENKAIFQPEISAGLSYDIFGDGISARSTYVGGGTSFETQGADPAQLSIDLGLAASYSQNDQWDLRAEYDLEARSDYTAHTGMIRATYHF